jgi:uncharacterized protein
MTTPREFGLTMEEQKSLLWLSRAALKIIVRERRVPNVSEFPGFEISDNLRVHAGAFVTLHKSGRLRGCIGTIYSDDPLYQVVLHNTRAASLDDPRFPSVAPDELGDIDIEISVLSPLEQVKEVEEIEVGTHGLYVVREPMRGLLLPQVATEYGWTRDEFLQHTSLKAGLPADGWKKATIFRFNAEVFGEKEFGY